MEAFLYPDPFLVRLSSIRFFCYQFYVASSHPLADSFLFFHLSLSSLYEYQVNARPYWLAEEAGGGDKAYDSKKSGILSLFLFYASILKGQHCYTIVEDIVVVLKLIFLFLEYAGNKTLPAIRRPLLLGVQPIPKLFTMSLWTM